MKRLVLLFAVLTLLPAAYGIDVGQAFDDPELQARYEKIIAEVRCLKCQNQTIKDSNAFLASDLRREIRRLLEEGKSDDEIYDFLVARYGEFALYRPRTSGRTLILWIAPLASSCLVPSSCCASCDDAWPCPSTTNRQGARSAMTLWFWIALMCLLAALFIAWPLYRQQGGFSKLIAGSVAGVLLVSLALYAHARQP